MLVLAPARRGELVGLLEEFVELVEALRQCGERLNCRVDLYELSVRDGRSLAEVLFDEAAMPELDQALRHRVQLTLDRAVTWDALPFILHSPVVAGTQVESLSIARAHAEELAGRGQACLGLSSGPWHGPVRVLISGIGREIHFVSVSAHAKAFQRAVIEVEDLDGEAFFDHAPLAFDALAFAPDLSRQWNRLPLSYREARALVSAHLAALNDYFSLLFREHHGQPAPVMAAMSALTRVDLSPESPRTHAFHAAMNERDVAFGGSVLRCEWHTKLTPAAGRIHFHPGNAQTGGRIFIGLMADHLTLAD